MVLALAFLIGCVCGLRSMTGPALVCWGAHFGWLQLDGSKLGFLHNNISLAVFTLLALGELVADKLPFIPSRITPGPLVVRFLFGAVCGVAFCVSSGAAWLLGAILGGIGAVAGAYAGYHLRYRLTTASGLPDIVVALVEDVVAIGGGLLIVSRF
ncbi:hypothetical protein ACPOL_5696 [Acidisarcina polymorpha]|uniref:DUF4126 domain-containing protein n=1 Tax=Acidisarcina polymorpha TaxID=2211140 RepID=A0A2Z5G6S0_9BACT|nr:hypothetical protein ACPOL_5696 [Acidisarcina polymorpha]